MLMSTQNSTENLKFKTIEELTFDNQAIQRLPVDPILENTPRKVKNACFSIVEPTPVKNPQTVVWSSSALALLDLNAEEETKKPSFAHYFSGNFKIPGSRPAAHCYCGHQFGYFSGQLGDGATMYLGEVINSKNDRWEIQFKGAGKTPYSRTADGRKVLRSSLREFLCSEAVFHLGIPTTRAASVVTSDTKVIRDIFYTGNPIEERATIIMRIAKSFLRFGSFEICRPTDPLTHRSGPNPDDHSLLYPLLHYTVEQFYPEIANQFPADQSAKRAESLIFEVVRRTARLVALWQCFGFCHGVLNTDNMSILGDTIDYGPFGFLEFYDGNYICNSSDDGGRYTYAAQPEICRWNCNVLADSLSPIVEVDRSKLDQIFTEVYEKEYYSLMSKKLGLLLPLSSTGDHQQQSSPSPSSSSVDNSTKHQPIINLLLKTFEETHNDWTNTFRVLMYYQVDEKGGDNREQIIPLLLDQTIPLSLLKERTKPKVPLQSLQQLLALPKAALLSLNIPPDLLLKEHQKHQIYQRYEKMTNDSFRATAEEAWRSFLSAYSSILRSLLYGDDGGEVEEQKVEERKKLRVEMMRQSNPKYILRNWIAQHAIDEAEEGNYDVAHSVLKLLSDPFALSEASSSSSSSSDVPHLNNRNNNNNDNVGDNNTPTSEDFTIYTNVMMQKGCNVDLVGKNDCNQFVRFSSQEIRVT